MYIGCDLFSSSIKFQVITNFVLHKLKKKFKKIKIIKITPENKININLDKIEVYWGNRINENLIKKMPNLKWIHFASTGFNNSIYKSVKKRKIQVTNTQKVYNNAVSSTVFSYIFSLARGVHYCQSLKKEKKLNRKNFDKILYNIQDVYNQKILIVGLGDIGKNIASTCNSMNMDVFAIKKKINSSPRFIKKTFAIYNLSKAVKNMDYVINLLPLTNLTKNVFNKKIFRLMKKTSFLINVGRGGTVNEKDLLNAIKNKIICGAALDVLEEEPIKKNSPLLKESNLIITPHIAGVTNNYWVDQYNLFTKNLLRYKKGIKLLNFKSYDSLKEGY